MSLLPEEKTVTTVKILEIMKRAGGKEGPDPVDVCAMLGVWSESFSASFGVGVCSRSGLI